MSISSDFDFVHSFFISGHPRDEMPDFYFKIDADGVVKVKNSLDYEKIKTHIVKILAIDKGK